MTVSFELQGVGFSFDGKKVIDGVSLSLAPGKFYGVVGPNGCGKTTLLSLILGDNPQAYINDVVLFGKRRGTGESI